MIEVFFLWICWLEWQQGHSTAVLKPHKVWMFLVVFFPQENFLICRLFMTNVSHRTQMPSNILDVEFCRIHSTILTSHHQIVTCLVLWKRAFKDTIIPITRHEALPKAVRQCLQKRKNNFHRPIRKVHVQRLKKTVDEEGVSTDKYLCFQQNCSKFLWNFRVSNL